MNERRSGHRAAALNGWLMRRTTLGEAFHSLLGRPSKGFSAWARTTAGLVVLLLFLQMTTGLLLGFYYVPSASSAHVTTAYIEKVADAGSWVRALHYHGSQWLPVTLVLHLAQMLWRGSWREHPVGWLASIALLALVLLNGATGYSLPWDVRAFYSTRVASGIAGGMPLVGDHLRRWLLGDEELSTLTVSRFYALHVFVGPLLILLVVTARLFVFRDRRPVNLEASSTDSAWARAQFMRNSVVAGLAFVVLATYAAKFPAPLGPPADATPPGYLPRPGAQFLWLFQLLKYMPGVLASVVALALPALMLGGLALLPLVSARRNSPTHHPRRNFGLISFASGLLLVLTLTAFAYFEDARNPHVREQLARQARDEEAFRRAPFEPLNIRSDDGANGDAAKSETSSAAAPPAAYLQNCARCHGARGEGRSINPKLVGVSAQPNRTVKDLIAIINNPSSYGLEQRMPSFAQKLSEEDKRAIAEWIASLK